MSSSVTDYLVSFGSNSGDRDQSFRHTIDRLSNHQQIDHFQASRVFQTKPVGGPKGQDEYLNAAMRFQSGLQPQEVHQLLKDVELEMGRLRAVRWASRTIDLDLLLAGKFELKSETLTVPHPRMSFRKFVLDPAIEIASEMVHPYCQQTVGELAANLTKRPNCVSIVSPHFVQLSDAISSDPNMSVADRQSFDHRMNIRISNSNQSPSDSSEQLSAVQQDVVDQQEAWDLLLTDDFAAIPESDKVKLLLVVSSNPWAMLGRIRNHRDWHGAVLALHHPARSSECDANSFQHCLIELRAALEAMIG